MDKRLRQAGGFTLLELLMVVIIIAILAALALPGYFRAVEKARTAEATIAMGQVRGAVQRYCVQYGIPPTPAQNFTVLDIENPNTAANRQFTYAWPAAGFVCGPPMTFTAFTATRRAPSPCAGSTVIMNDPPLAGITSMFTYTWLGSCI